MSAIINKIGLCPGLPYPCDEEGGVSFMDPSSLLEDPSGFLPAEPSLKTIWPEYFSEALLTAILKEDPSFALHLNWDKVLIPAGSSFTSLTIKLIEEKVLPLDILFRTQGLVKKIYFEGGLLDLLCSIVKAEPKVFADIPQRYRLLLYRTEGMRRAIARHPGNIDTVISDREFISAGEYFNVIAEAARTCPDLFTGMMKDEIFAILDFGGDDVLSFLDLFDDAGAIAEDDLIDIYRALSGANFELLTHLYANSPLEDQALFAHIWENALFTSLVIESDRRFLEGSANPFYILRAVARTDPDYLLTRLAADLARLKLEAEGAHLHLLNIACFGAQTGGSNTLYPPCFGNPDLLFASFSREPAGFQRLSYYDQRLFYRLERGKEILKKNPGLIKTLVDMSDRIHGEVYWEIVAGMAVTDPLLFAINDPAFIAELLDRNKDGRIDINDFVTQDFRIAASDFVEIYDKVLASKDLGPVQAMKGVLSGMWGNEEFDRHIKENAPAMYAARHDEETIKTVSPTLAGMKYLLKDRTSFLPGERWKAVMEFLKKEPETAKKRGRAFIRRLLDRNGDGKVTLADIQDARHSLPNAQFKELCSLLIPCGYNLIGELLRKDMDWGSFNDLWQEKDFVRLALDNDKEGFLKRARLPRHILFGIARTDAWRLLKDFRRELLELKASSPKDYREILRIAAQECPFYNVSQGLLFDTYLDMDGDGVVSLTDFLRPDGTGFNRVLIKTLSWAVRQTGGPRSDLYAALLKDMPEDQSDPNYGHFWGTRFLVEEAVRLYPSRKSEFVKRHEDEVNSRFVLKDVTYRYDDLIYPERLDHSALLLRKVLTSRARPNKGRKIALVIQSRSDWNGAFEDTKELLFRLYMDHEVIYRVVDEKGKIKGILDDVTSVPGLGGNGNGGKKRLAGLVFSGHGRPDRIELNSGAGDENGYLTVADMKALHLEEYIDGSAFIVLDACNVAKKNGGGGENLAEGVAEMTFEGVKVFAAPYPVSEASIRYNRFGSPYSDVDVYFFSTDEARYIRSKEFSGSKHFLDSVVLTDDLPITPKSPNLPGE